ncbi:MAG TPA: regulatory protein RecX [Anaerolineaceae bacterium]|nr:regulatory protein RecX [Anaerolineaceae bacterium]
MEKVITAIRVQKRNPNRVNVDLDGEFAFGLSRIVAAWLKVGDRLSDQRVTELVASDTDEVLYQKALNLLSRRPYSAHEVRSKLLQKDFPNDKIEATLKRLAEAGLLADEKFASQWVENRNNNHPRSQRLIKYELQRKGITNDVIDTALAGSEQDSELAYRAAVPYARRLQQADWLTFSKRLGGFLARRGFSYGIADPVVHQVWDLMKKGEG